MTNHRAMTLQLKTMQIQGELRQLSPDTLHYVRHGIADESELHLVATICEHSEALIELLTQISDKRQ